MEHSRTCPHELKTIRLKTNNDKKKGKKKMEIILAIVVASAVIFFGALISIGNERQKKAIDGLREQTILWAIQDLIIKRKILARNVQVDDPLSWLNTIVSKVSETEIKLQVVEVLGEPRVLVCANQNGDRVLFSPHSPHQIRKYVGNRNNGISRFENRNRLISLTRRMVAHRISVLNGGYLFDLELPLAWKKLTGQEISNLECVWMYTSKRL